MLSRRNLIAVLVLALVTMLSGTAVRAADKNDATGTWTWSFERNGNTVQSTLKLKQDGDKLTGAMVGRNNNETPITEGKVANGEISFKVTRKNQNGDEFTTSYSGKVEGDTIKGKITGRNGNARDWEAKRSKEEEKK